MKQDYFNFKKYINCEFAPKHMDFLNNDCAPDLLRFMSIKIGGKKNVSYYNFLKGIEEENLPTFTDAQINFANYLSAMLPLVRKHEYLIFDCLLRGIKKLSAVEDFLMQISKVARKKRLNTHYSIYIIAVLYRKTSGSCF